MIEQAIIYVHAKFELEQKSVQIGGEKERNQHINSCDWNCSFLSRTCGTVHLGSTTRNYSRADFSFFPLPAQFFVQTQIFHARR